MDSSTLVIVLVTSATVGAAFAGVSFYFGFRAGRRAAITHGGIRQAREVRDQMLAGIILPAKLADGSVTLNRIADGAVIQNRIADGAVKEPFIFKVGGRPIKPN